MRSYVAMKKRLLKRKGVNVSYSKLEPEFTLLQSIIEKRLKLGLTQAELARKIGTKQSAVARLESGGTNPSVGLLTRVASALHADLVISIS